MFYQTSRHSPPIEVQSVPLAGRAYPLRTTPLQCRRFQFIIVIRKNPCERLLEQRPHSTNSLIDVDMLDRCEFPLLSMRIGSAIIPPSRKSDKVLSLSMRVYRWYFGMEEGSYSDVSNVTCDWVFSAIAVVDREPASLWLTLYRNEGSVTSFETIGHIKGEMSLSIPIFGSKTVKLCRGCWMSSMSVGGRHHSLAWDTCQPPTDDRSKPITDPISQFP